MTPAISVQGLYKRFRLGEFVGARTFRESIMGVLRRRPREPVEEIWALQDVSFEVPQGEVLGVIGKNGAGKSTLLKILTGITEPTEGRVELSGRVASLLEVGTGFHAELTGRENVYLNGSILGMSRAEIRRKFDEIVEFSGVERFLDTPVKRYSSGMYMRLAFSVAAHLEQEILLVDEVLAVGDAEFQKKCLSKMDDVAKTGRTVLFVSHNLGAVRRISHRVISLRDGALWQDGSPDEVVRHYFSEAAAAEPDHTVPTWMGPWKQSGVRIRPNPKIVSADCGASATLEFELEGRTPLTDVAIGLYLLDNEGTIVRGTHSQAFPSCKVSGTGSHWSVALTLHDLALLPGRYHVDLFIGDTHQHLARIDQAFMLDILTANDLGVDEFPPSWGYGFMRPHLEATRLVRNAESESDPPAHE